MLKDINVKQLTVSSVYEQTNIYELRNIQKLKVGGEFVLKQAARKSITESENLGGLVSGGGGSGLFAEKRKPGPEVEQKKIGVEKSFHYLTS